jgi:hypothetical protein
MTLPPAANAARERPGAEPQTDLPAAVALPPVVPRPRGAGADDAAEHVVDRDRGLDGGRRLPAEEVVAVREAVLEPLVAGLKVITRGIYYNRVRTYHIEAQ